MDGGFISSKTVCYIHSFMGGCNNRGREKGVSHKKKDERKPTKKEKRKTREAMGERKLPVIANIQNDLRPYNSWNWRKAKLRRLPKREGETSPRLD